MTGAPSDDAAAFRDDQRAAWDSVAGGWKAWWSTFERGAQPVNDVLVELARLTPGHTVLDVATGLGEPALSAARRVGAAGRVVGIDLAPQMLDVAGARIAASGVGNVELRAMDAEQLELPAGSFDAAVSRWGLMLMRDPQLVATEVRRVLRAGGRFAAAVWASAEEAPFLALPGRVLRAELKLPAPDPDAPGPLRLGSYRRLSAVLEAAGFGAIETGDVHARLAFASGEEYARFVQELSSATRKLLQERTPQERDRVWAAVAREAERCHTTDDGVVFDNRVLCAVGVA